MQTKAGRSKGDHAIIKRNGPKGAMLSWGMVRGPPKFCHLISVSIKLHLMKNTTESILFDPDQRPIIV